MVAAKLRSMASGVIGLNATGRTTTITVKAVKKPYRPSH